MQRLIVNIVLRLLKTRLSIENRALLINGILDRLAMLPLRSIINVNSAGSLEIRGKVVDFEEAKMLIESAKALRTNRAFQLIQDEVLYISMSYSVNGTKCFDDVYAAKMAVWWGMEENKQLKILAGEME